MARFEIRIAHELDDELIAAFEGLEVEADGSFTIIIGDFDQAGLQGMLQRIRSLDLELVDARRLRGSN